MSTGSEQKHDRALSAGRSPKINLTPIPHSQSIHSQSRLSGTPHNVPPLFCFRAEQTASAVTRDVKRARSSVFALRKSAAREMQRLSTAEVWRLFAAFIPTRMDWRQICPWWVLITGFNSCTLRMKRTFFSSSSFFVWQAWWQIFSPRVNQMREEKTVWEAWAWKHCHVVCSRESTKGAWVDSEKATFMSMRRTEAADLCRSTPPPPSLLPPSPPRSEAIVL